MKPTKKKEKPRLHQVRLLLPEAEYERLKKAAARDGRSIRGFANYATAEAVRKELG